MIRLISFILILAGCVQSDYKYIGQEYLGAKYLSDPLGEGLPPDSDPIFRTDAFDCTTFVETAMANGDVGVLTKIRYKDGQIDFLNRNHFIESDWLINNSDIVENVSAQYAPVSQRAVIIDKQNWLKTVYGIDSDIPQETIVLNYIPYEKLPQIYSTEPLIVLFISGKSEKSDKIGTDLAVRHMGFLLPNGMLRHASSKHGYVMDVDFYKYVEQRAKDANNIGIMLVRIK